MPGTRKLGRKTDHRMAMLKGMVTFLLEQGKIETTLTRAREVSALAEKMITMGKENTLANKRRAFAFIKKEDVALKLFNEISPAYADRSGGYTRVLKLGPRRGDGAEMALITLVDADKIYGKKKDGKEGKGSKETKEAKTEKKSK